MIPYHMLAPSTPLEFGLVILGAVLIDLMFGDPKNRYHPTAWAGGLISKMISHFAGYQSRMQRFGGMTSVVVAISAAVLALYVLSHAFMYNQKNIPEHAPAAAFAHVLASILIGCVLLKSTIAINGMQRHAHAVVKSLQDNDVARARDDLSMIVKRKTGSLDQTHIISGVLESISENTVDGVTGSLFYYGLFGLPGAFAHRIVNTADSMAGYQNDMLRHLGWFAARADTVLNYLPARLTALAMVGAAALLRYDWKKSYHTVICDGSTTESCNSGYPMAALAGALNVRLEKEGHYALCKNGTAPLCGDVRRAVLLMKFTTLVFAACVVLPVGILCGTLYGIIFGGVVF